MKLSPRQERFVQEYLTEPNGAQAAIRAGYSAKCAKEQAARLLTYANVKAAIDAGRKRIMHKAEVTQEEVVRGLKGEAELYGDGSSHSARVSAWAHLGKYLGMFTDKIEMSGPGGGPLIKEVVIEHHSATVESSPGGSPERPADPELPPRTDPGVAVNGSVPSRLGGHS